MSPFHELGACKIGTSNPFKRSNYPACRASPWKAPRQAQNSCWIGHQRYLHRPEFFMCKLCFQFATADILQRKIASKEPLPNLNAQMLHAKLLDQKQRCDKQTLDQTMRRPNAWKTCQKTASTLIRAWFPSPSPGLEIQPWMANETCEKSVCKRWMTSYKPIGATRPFFVPLPRDHCRTGAMTCSQQNRGYNSKVLASGIVQLNPRPCSIHPFPWRVNKKLAPGSAETLVSFKYTCFFFGKRQGWTCFHLIQVMLSPMLHTSNLPFISTPSAVILIVHWKSLFLRQYFCWRHWRPECNVYVWHSSDIPQVVLVRG